MNCLLFETKTAARFSIENRVSYFSSKSRKLSFWKLKTLNGQRFKFFNTGVSETKLVFFLCKPEIARAFQDYFKMLSVFSALRIRFREFKC